MNNSYDFKTNETFLTISFAMYSTWTSIDTCSRSLFRICQFKRKRDEDKRRATLEGDGERQCSMAVNIHMWWCITSDTSRNTSHSVHTSGWHLHDDIFDLASRTFVTRKQQVTIEHVQAIAWHSFQVTQRTTFLPAFT